MHKHIKFHCLNINHTHIHTCHASIHTYMHTYNTDHTYKFYITQVHTEYIRNLHTYIPYHTIHTIHNTHTDTYAQTCHIKKQKYNHKAHTYITCQHNIPTKTGLHTYIPYNTYIKHITYIPYIHYTHYIRKYQTYYAYTHTHKR